MSKKTGDDALPTRITISVTDAPPEPNATLYGLLRDGEKMKPGDPRGTLLDRLGHEVQDFMAQQIRVAKHRRTAVKGTVTLTIAVTTGPDGSQGYAVEAKTKGAKIPPGVSMVFTDEEGDLLSRPVEPLTEEMYRRARAAGEKTAEPKVGSPSKM